MSCSLARPAGVTVASPVPMAVRPLPHDLSLFFFLSGFVSFMILFFLFVFFSQVNASILLGARIPRTHNHHLSTLVRDRGSARHQLGDYPWYAFDSIIR
jgi:hypothetical protein